jgi:hypothetical protein
MPAAGRVVEVDVGRLAGWVDRFTERHGEADIAPAADASVLVITARDGARAEVAIPYGPLPDALPDPLSDPLSDPGLIARLVDHVRRPRTVGVLLVRRGGWAVGVVERGRLVASEVGGGYVQGRTKAGGWSQQRYARRRGNQAQQVWGRAADGAAEVLLRPRASLESLATGGDRTGVAAVLADPRLAGLEALVESRFFASGDPTRSVLDDVVDRLQTVAITLNELA